jgi:outer membrane lipase/esterase
MSFNWLRRAFVLAACVSPLLLASCGGGGSVESEFKPTRVIAFGDGFSDVGQRGSRYTVNDATTNVWAQEFAGRYGVGLNAVSVGGTSYATGNARVNTKPDAVGNSSTLTVKEQIDTFLSAQSFSGNDLVIVSGGIGDIVAEIARMNSGAQTSAQMLANVAQAGRDLGAQVRRVVQAGGKFVAVTGTYNLGKSPWAVQTAQVSVLESASSKFNDELLISIVDLGANVLYVDAALQFNLMVNVPSSYSLTNASTPVCTSVDPGPGIGTGSGQINSALCTPATVLGGVDPNTYLFADRIYPSAQGHRLFGDYAYERFRTRF